MTVIDSSTPLNTIGNPASPFTWLRIVWSVWFDPVWYQTNIHPRLADREQKWILLLLACLGSLLISIVCMAAITFIQSQIASITSVYTDVYSAWYFVFVLGTPIILGIIGTVLQSKKRLPFGISALAGSTALSVSYLISMLSVWLTLLLIPMNPSVAASADTFRYKLILTPAFPFFVFISLLNTFAYVDVETVKVNSRSQRILQGGWLRFVTGLIVFLLIVWQGISVVLSDWRYYPYSGSTLLSFFIRFIGGAVVGLVFGLAICAWHYQVRARLMSEATPK